MTTILFICSQNHLRSPTAEQVFADYPGLEVSSAGTNHDAENPLTAGLVSWADIIVVMEKQHRAKVQRRFRAACNVGNGSSASISRTTIPSCSRNWWNCSRHAWRGIFRQHDHE
ncbi:hypothetical protein [Novosphingobium sp. SG707]|uniref:arsenate reductase/protein-tyrosine-phosphatase family protein n=1 Tax=Novosphingobium sp. SG707 TaxID=2586996 RepID=UPI0018116BB9|nr:putative protein tyrosine phosphatase [Novosphingobium sp. SG707]